MRILDVRGRILAVRGESKTEGVLSGTVLSTHLGSSITWLARQNVLLFYLKLVFYLSNFLDSTGGVPRGPPGP